MHIPATCPRVALVRARTHLYLYLLLLCQYTDTRNS
jgi:hypothetical protein